MPRSQHTEQRVMGAHVHARGPCTPCPDSTPESWAQTWGWFFATPSALGLCLLEKLFSCNARCYHGLLHLKVNLFHITDYFSIAMHKESPQSRPQPASAKSIKRNTGDPVAARMQQCAFWEVWSHPKLARAALSLEAFHPLQNS